MDQDQINRLRKTNVSPQGLFIAGAWQRGAAAPLDVISPINGQRLTSIADATKAEVDQAVSAARAAFEDRRWSGMAPTGRKRILIRLAELIERDASALTVLGVRDNGTEIAMAQKAEPGSAAATFRYYGEAVDKIYGEIAPTAPGFLGLIHREAVGVVGAIVPWNFPLMIGAWKLAPALAAGNSVVLKPAETASLSLLRLAELAAEAGVPDGVLNVVTGRGDGAGDALARSMDVDVLAFTGSGATGRHLLQASAQSNLKRVYLELGGKSPNIVFSDAPDLDVAARAAAAIFRNAGQVCVAGSRLLVEEAIYDDFMTALIRETKALQVGDPLDITTQIGAINSAAQMQRVLQHIRQASDDGIDITTGGEAVLAETGGYYLAPTIASGVTLKHALAQEEVFGPVLAVSRFKGEAEAVTIANGTAFGLAAGVWTRDLSRAHRLVRAIKAGVVHVNTYGGADGTVPLGGVKQSGNGVDKSLHALDKYTDLKTAWMQI